MSMIKRLSDKAWIWSFIGMFLVWLATAVYTGGTGSAEVVSAALSFAHRPPATAGRIVLLQRG